MFERSIQDAKYKLQRQRFVFRFGGVIKFGPPTLEVMVAARIRSAGPSEQLPGTAGPHDGRPGEVK